jgi:hypothetical protein
MNNACPGCGAAYAVAEKDVGRRIACKKCGTALIVAATGLVRDDVDAPSPPPNADDDEPRNRRRERDDDDDDRSRRKRPRDDDSGDSGRAARRKARAAQASEWLNKLRVIADVPTWLYGIGLFLAIYGFFASRIDQAKLLGRIGDQESAAAEQLQDEREYGPSSDASASEKESRKKRRDEYAKTKARYDERIAYAKASANQAAWWNEYCKLIGCLLLAIGSIGFIRMEQAPTKRILGAVTVAIILLGVTGRGFELKIQP